MLYNYLLAGLDELSLNQKQRLSLDDLLALMREQLTQRDAALLDLLLMTKDDTVISGILEENPDLQEETSLSEDDLRTQLLYEYGMRCRNGFVRDWFEFNLNLNNVLAATICRKHGFDIQKAVIGNNEVAQQLRKNSSARDFGLAGILPELNDIMRLAAIENLLERERHIDALRWQWTEEHTIFHNFEIENVLTYYLQAAMLHRWDNLSREEGEQVFRQLLMDLKKGIKF